MAFAGIKQQGADPRSSRSARFDYFANKFLKKPTVPGGGMVAGVVKSIVAPQPKQPAPVGAVIKNPQPTQPQVPQTQPPSAQPQQSFTQPVQATPIKPTEQQAGASADAQGLSGIERQRFIENQMGFRPGTGKDIPRTDTTPAGPITPQQQAELDYARQGGLGKRPDLTLGQGAQPASATLTPQQQLEASRNKYLDTLTPDADIEAQRRDLANFQTGVAQAIAGEEGQGRGRTVNLVRGRQALIQEQAQLEEANRIAMLELSMDQRTQAQQRALVELGFAKDDVEAILKAQAPFEFGGNLVQFDPTTGQLKTIAEAPAEAVEPITLSPGETVIDPATGEVLYQAGYKPEALPSSIQEYLFAVNQGYEGDYATFSQQQGGTGQFSAEASKLIANANSGLRNIETMLGTVERNFGRGILGNFTNREYKFAENNLVDIIGRLRSGGAITKEEEKRFKDLLPKVSDTDQVAKYKLGELNRLLTETINNTGGQVTNSGVGGGTGDALDQVLDEIFGPSFNSDLGTSVNGQIGVLSERYESGGDPGAIGYDSTGGYSYGAYQLAHSNAKKFIEQSPFAKLFAGIQFNSAPWRQRWKDIAKQNPAGFKEAQKQYIKETHFDPQIQKLASAGVNVSNLPPVLLDVIWSTAVQHGPNNNIVINAFKKLPPTATLADAVKAIYNERWSGGANFASSTPAVKQSVYNRFFGQNGELNMALQKLS